MITGGFSVIGGRPSPLKSFMKKRKRGLCWSTAMGNYSNGEWEGTNFGLKNTGKDWNMTRADKTNMKALTTDPLCQTIHHGDCPRAGGGEHGMLPAASKQVCQEEQINPECRHYAQNSCADLHSSWKKWIDQCILWIENTLKKILELRKTIKPGLYGPLTWYAHFIANNREIKYSNIILANIN